MFIWVRGVQKTEEPKKPPKTDRTVEFQLGFGFIF